MICYIGLGGNLGERAENLRTAIERVKKIAGVELLRVLSMWGLLKIVNAAVKT